MSPGPCPAQDAPHTGACCRCRHRAESGCASRGCAESGVCAPGRRGQRPRGLRWDRGQRRGEEAGAGGQGGRGEVLGTKATRGKGERQGGHPKTRGCPGRGGAGPGGHAAIHALKPRAEMRGRRPEPCQESRPEPSLHRPRLCYRSGFRAKPTNWEILGHELGDRDPHCIKQVTNENLSSSTGSPAHCSAVTWMGRKKKRGDRTSPGVPG